MVKHTNNMIIIFPYDPKEHPILMLLSHLTGLYQTDKTDWTKCQSVGLRSSSGGVRSLSVPRPFHVRSVRWPPVVSGGLRSSSVGVLNMLKTPTDSERIANGSLSVPRPFLVRYSSVPRPFRVRSTSVLSGGLWWPPVPVCRSFKHV